jgi:hypothetical protein
LDHESLAGAGVIDTQRYHRDGIVFPAWQIDVSGFAAGYARFQSDSRRLRGRETYLKPHLVSAGLAALEYPRGFGEAKRSR